MRDTFIRELTVAARANPRISLITGDLGFGVLTEFAQEFPAQFLNAGVAEQNMTAVAAGMALEGRKLFTYSIGNFPTLRCLEQVRNDICYHDLDVTIVSIGGGFSYGQLGMSHFATEDLAILRALPNMKVYAPTGLWETAELVRALIGTKGPAYLRLDKGAAESGPREGEVFSLGNARRLREGHDITLAATGAILSEAQDAAVILAKNGIQARIIAIHCVKPLDATEIINAARETGGIVTIEEHNRLGGLGSAVAECCLELAAVPRRFRALGLADEYPSVVGDQKYLRSIHRISADDIAKECISLLRGGDSGEAPV
jgi:transketolase